MKSRSIIQKGKRFENFVNKQIERAGLGKATRTPGSGSGKIKGDSFNNLEFMIEAKNQKKIDIKRWITQAKQQASIGNYDSNKWALVFRDPDYPEFERVNVVIDFWEWLELLKKNDEPRIKEPDREMKWKLQRMIDSARAVIRELK